MDHLRRTQREAALFRRANAHYGLLHHEHLVAHGLSATQIRDRLAHHRLTRIHDQVYAFGHTALREEARWLAGLWVAGDEAGLTHWSAGAYHGWRLSPPDDDVHVSVAGTVRSRAGLTVHRVRHLDRVDVLHAHPLRVTHIPRTLVDLADVMRWPDYRALADDLPHLDVRAIRSAQERTPKRVGRGRVDRLLAADETHTRSEFERRFLRFAAAHGLPRPDGLNVRVAGHTADCRYDAARLVVELDGRAYHQRRARMRADRARDTDYQLAGYRIMRLVWDDLHPDTAARTADRLRRMLAVTAP